MSIAKQEFYEGAALHRLSRGGQITRIKHEPPFFFLNDKVLILLKYCTLNRSPWGFTFTAEEQNHLQRRANEPSVRIGLICGSDGIATLDLPSYQKIATLRASAIRISCFRQHNEHYEISGPDGVMSKKVAPSAWQKILEI